MACSTSSVPLRETDFKGVSHAETRRDAENGINRKTHRVDSTPNRFFVILGVTQRPLRLCAKRVLKRFISRGDADR